LLAKEKRKASCPNGCGLFERFCQTNQQVAMSSYDEQFLARVFDSVTDPMAIYDRDFKILRVNQALTSLFKLSAQQIIGKNCYDVFYNRTQICDECHVDDVFRNGEKRMLEKVFPLPDGSKRIFEVHSYPIKDENGITIQAVEHSRDISERKFLEDQLLSSKEFNEKIINSITDSLVVLDPDTHTIIQANAAFCSRVGLKPAAVIGKKCHEIMLGRSKPCTESGIKCSANETILSKCPALSSVRLTIE